MTRRWFLLGREVLRIETDHQPTEDDAWEKSSVGSQAEFGQGSPVMGFAPEYDERGRA